MRVELDLLVRESRPGEREPDLTFGHDRLVPGVGHDEHDEAVEGEPCLRNADERDVAHVRWVEHGAEEAGHWYSNVSSPTATSSPSRAPAARRAASSSSSSGGRPTTR